MLICIFFSLQSLADPYFRSLSNIDREPSTQPISKLEFEFERRKLTKDDVRELIYREILEYHPQMLQEYLRGADQTNFMYPSGVDRFKRQFAHLEEHYGKGDRSTPLQRQHASLPRERIGANKDSIADRNNEFEGRSVESVARSTLESPTKSQQGVRSDQSSVADGLSKSKYSARSLLKSESISASKCVVVKQRKDKQDQLCSEHVLYYSSMKLVAKIISAVYPIRRNQDLRPQIRWLMDCPTSWLSYILEACSFGELGEQCRHIETTIEAQAQIRLSDRLDERYEEQMETSEHDGVAGIKKVAIQDRQEQHQKKRTCEGLLPH
ncbi:MAP kinase [Musa troglodytarum]|uniref:MAP kinase n=1 Tax=Musa troglodytarum TaxID=320322 RepID=A0A9E7FKZ9_9LILI|nr:MAP kinase [Musa troglodytarum]